MRAGIVICSCLTLAVLTCTTIYETAWALGAFPAPTLRGQGPAGSESVLVVTLFAIVVAIVCTVLASMTLQPSLLTAALTPLAAMFVTARQFTFDPYYAPTLRRIADGGVVSEAWVFALLVAAWVACSFMAARSSPRLMALGAMSGSVLLVLCLFTVVAQGAGH